MTFVPYTLRPRDFELEVPRQYGVIYDSSKARGVTEPRTKVNEGWTEAKTKPGMWGSPWTMKVEGIWLSERCLPETSGEDLRKDVSECWFLSLNFCLSHELMWLLPMAAMREGRERAGIRWRSLALLDVSCYLESPARGLRHPGVWCLLTSLLSPTSKPGLSPWDPGDSASLWKEKCQGWDSSLALISSAHKCVSLFMSIFRMLLSWQMALSPAATVHQAMWWQSWLGDDLGSAENSLLLGTDVKRGFV